MKQLSNFALITSLTILLILSGCSRKDLDTSKSNKDTSNIEKKIESEAVAESIADKTENKASEKLPELPEAEVDEKSIDKVEQPEGSFWSAVDDELWVSGTEDFFAENDDFFSDTEDFFDDGAFAGENDEWREYLKSSGRNWDEYIQQVEDRWNNYEESTKKDWVEYGSDLNSKSIVDFEKGIVEIEAIAAENLTGADQIAENRLNNQLQAILNTDELTGSKPLEGQLRRKQINKNEIARSTYIAKDGKKRVKVTVTIPMVPNHLKIRAEKYLPDVQVWASKYGLPVSFIMAIIHTESYFNPQAKSPANAFGLMQIIPRFAGVEAMRHLTGRSQKPSVEYLFKPPNNIKIGVTYFSLLFNNYFNAIKDPVKRGYIVTSAYNWGPTNINKKIVAKYRVDEMDSEKLYSLLQNRTPKETGNYLSRVTSRQKLYEEWNLY